MQTLGSETVPARTSGKEDPWGVRERPGSMRSGSSAAPCGSCAWLLAQGFAHGQPQSLAQPPHPALQPATQHQTLTPLTTSSPPMLHPPKPTRTTNPHAHHSNQLSRKQQQTTLTSATSNISPRDGKPVLQTHTLSSPTIGPALCPNDFMASLNERGQPRGEMGRWMGRWLGRLAAGQCSSPT